MKKILIVIIMMVGLIGMQSIVSAQEYNFNVANLEPVEAPTNLALNRFIELVEERTDGDINIINNPGGELGTGLELVEGVSMGSIDMTKVVLEWYAPFVNDFNVYTTGFTFDDGDHFRKFLNSEIYEDMITQAEEKLGIKVIADNWVALPRIMASTKPIYEPEDLHGLSMRVPEIEMYLRTWEALGTSPTQIAWAEVYLALDTGTVEAAEGPADQMYATGFYEPAPYLIETNHLQQVFTVAINENVWNSLNNEYQQIMLEAADEAGEWFENHVRDEYNNQREKMIEGGAEFIEVDQAAFRAVLSDLIETAEDEGYWAPGLHEAIQELNN